MLTFLSTVYGSSFESVTLKRWMAAVEIQQIEGVKEGRSIKEPKNTALSVLDIILLREGKSLSKDCLFYHTPSSDKAGRLYVVSLKNVNNSCRDHILDRPLVQKNEIFNFGIKLEKKLTLLIDEKTIEYNTNIGEDTVFSILAGVGGLKLKEGDICFDVNDQCQISQPDYCKFCPESTQRVITGNCPGIYRKYCKKKICGERNLPACIRGIKSTGYKTDICINDSPVGFCKNGLRVICKDNELICL